jgi:hypothetical protein
MLLLASLARIRSNVQFDRLPRRFGYLTRVTRSVPNQVFTWKNDPLRLRPGGMGHAFSRTCGSESHMFWKKIQTYHAAASESSFHRVKRPV